MHVDQFIAYLDGDKDAEGKIQWLQDNTEPKQQVCQWMKETCKMRAGYIRDNKDKPVHPLLQLFSLIQMVW